MKGRGDQLEIEAHARRTDPGTSHAAAASVTPRIRESQDLVLRALRRLGPATDETLVAYYADAARRFPGRIRQQSPSGIRTRRRELTDAELVFDTGRRTVLKSGRKAIVWAAR